MEDNSLCNTTYCYREEFINFFKDSNLGKFENVLLQEHSDMNLFFEHQTGSLTVTASLFNIWGKINMIRNNSTKIVLDDNSRKYLKEALISLEMKKRDNVVRFQDSNNLVEQRRANIELQKFLEGEILTKDYMFIIAFYRIPESDNYETSNEDKSMIRITRSLNSMMK